MSEQEGDGASEYSEHSYYSDAEEGSQIEYASRSTSDSRTHASRNSQSQKSASSSSPSSRRTSSRSGSADESFSRDSRSREETSRGSTKESSSRSRISEGSGWFTGGHVPKGSSTRSQRSGSQSFSGREDDPSYNSRSQKTTTSRSQSHSSKSRSSSGLRDGQSYTSSGSQQQDSRRSDSRSGQHTTSSYSGANSRSEEKATFGEPSYQEEEEEESHASNYSTTPSSRGTKSSRSQGSRRSSRATSSKNDSLLSTAGGEEENSLLSLPDGHSPQKYDSDKPRSPHHGSQSQSISQNSGNDSESFYDEETIGSQSRSDSHQKSVSNKRSTKESNRSGGGLNKTLAVDNERDPFEPDYGQDSSFIKDVVVAESLPARIDDEVSTFPDMSFGVMSLPSSMEDASYSSNEAKSIKDEKRVGRDIGKELSSKQSTTLPSPRASPAGDRTEQYPNTNEDKDPDEQADVAASQAKAEIDNEKAEHPASVPKNESNSDRVDPFAVEGPKMISWKGRHSQKTSSLGRDHAPHRSDAAMSSEPSEVKFETVVPVQRCKSLAILGTMSDAGKSIMTAGLCRVLANKGVRVAPFKGQNMSNNAAPALLPDKARRKRLYKSFQTAVGGDFPSSLDNQVDTGYGEIGTAQSLQSEACRLVPRVEMNPVLLKSGGQNENGEYMCSVIVLGKQVARETYGDLGKRTTDLRTMVLESHEALAEATDCDVILMEGAGSCTELNLMDRDIVNLPLVRALGCPWLLVANIDCGGVFAQIVGTQMCVSKRDWSLCAGIIVNKLRGEAKYFEPGPEMIEDMVGKPVFVVPFLQDLHLPEEDGVGIDRRLAWEAAGHIHPDDVESTIDKKPIVVVVAYPRIAIADDMCPLEADPRFRVQWRRRRLPRPYPHTTSVILPGSRLTRMDLKWLHDSGWSAFLRNHVAAGGGILGICGGYQMLGWSVDDPHAVEGIAGQRQGLGLLPIRTTISLPELKIVEPRSGRFYPEGPAVKGFELHCGQTQIALNLGDALGDQVQPLLIFEDGKPEGMRVRRVRGTYLHGILRSPEARLACLVPDRREFPMLMLKEGIKVQDPLDRLAEHLEECGLDFPTLRGIISSHRNRQANS